MNRSVFVFVLFLSVLWPDLSFAAAQVEVRSDMRAYVYLDGKAMGRAPLRLPYVPGGEHRLLVTSLDGRRSREYVVKIPFGPSAPRVIDAHLATAPVVVVRPVTQPVVVVHPPPTVIRVAPAPVVVTPYHSHRRYRW